MSLTVDIEKELGFGRLKVSFQTKGEGLATGILGASGCGKSVTLKCIAGIMTPDRGRIVLNGRVLFDSENRIDMRVQDRRVGYLFQDYALFPHMTVLKNVGISLPGRMAGRDERIRKYMRLLQIEELSESYPDRISGGQRQRAALARILVSEPEVLMLDEPFSALDAYLKEKLQSELMEVLHHYRGDVLMATHSRDEIYRFCGRIHILKEGRIITSGDTAKVFQNPCTAAAARLTGCKNIGRFERISDNECRVPKWGVTFCFAGKIPEDAQYIGIRAHSFRAPKSGEKENVFACRQRRIMEEPFERTVILENGIWWKVTRQQWEDEYRGKMPKELTVREEDILFLRGDG